MGQNESCTKNSAAIGGSEAEVASVMFKGSDLGRNCECSLRKLSPGLEVGQGATPGFEAAIQLFIHGLCTFSGSGCKREGFTTLS